MIKFQPTIQVSDIKSGLVYGPCSDLRSKRPFSQNWCSVNYKWIQLDSFATKRTLILKDYKGISRKVYPLHAFKYTTINTCVSSWCLMTALFIQQLNETFFSLSPPCGYSLFVCYYALGTLLPTSYGSRSDISRDFRQQMYRIKSFPMSVVALIVACIFMIPKRIQSYLHSNSEKLLILFLVGVY